MLHAAGAAACALLPPACPLPTNTNTANVVTRQASTRTLRAWRTTSRATSAGAASAWLSWATPTATWWRTTCCGRARRTRQATWARGEIGCARRCRCMLHAAACLCDAAPDSMLSAGGVGVRPECACTCCAGPRQPIGSLQRTRALLRPTTAQHCQHTTRAGSRLCRSPRRPVAWTLGSDWWSGWSVLATGAAQAWWLRSLQRSARTWPSVRCFLCAVSRRLSDALCPSMSCARLLPACAAGAYTSCM